MANHPNRNRYRIVQGKDAEGRAAYGVAARDRATGLWREPTEFNLYSRKAARDHIRWMQLNE